MPIKLANFLCAWLKRDTAILPDNDRNIERRLSIRRSPHPPLPSDPSTSATVFRMMVGLVRDTGLSALIATHNPDLARQMDRAVTLQDGKLVAAEV